MVDPHDDHLSRVAAAFSQKATVYDAFGAGHIQLNRMRQHVYDHISQLVATGGHLLELNAGTGLDATEMVKRGYRVHATDIAPGMVAQIEAKRNQQQFQSRLTVQACSFTALNSISTGPFDGIYSNFGGLNCIPDLTAVTRQLPSLLKPDGIVTFVIMPPFCPWEMALMFKDPQVAMRRWRRQTMAHVEGERFTTWYFTARQAKQSFGPLFQVVKQEGLAIFTPTADNKTFAASAPRLYRRLCLLEDKLCHWWPFNHIGDFFILSMKYTPAITAS